MWIPVRPIRKRMGKFVAEMDRTSRLSSVYSRLRIGRQAKLIRAEPPPSAGRWTVAVPANTGVVAWDLFAE